MFVAIIFALIIIGSIIFLIGVFFPLFSKLPIGRLPGDVFYSTDKFTFAFPIITCIILSIIIRTLLSVLKVQDPYKIITVTGLISSFGLQSFINIFSSLGLIPTKGMTLPFVSYGGSSMISISILFGFLLSITNKNNE